MAPTNLTERMSVAVAVLQRTTPGAWEDFETVLAALSKHADDTCIFGTPENLPRAQGRAQQLRELLNTFRGAQEITRQIEERAKNVPQFPTR